MVDKSAHIGNYEAQSKTLVEKEFSVIQLDCRSDLASSSPPGEQAVISSLAQSNYSEMHRGQRKSHKQQGQEAAEDGDMFLHLKSARYAPFGPVIQTDKSSKKHFGEKKCVTNVAVGGRANFANCFIRTACHDHIAAKTPLNVGDGVFMASFLVLCDDNAYGNNKVFRTFNFLIVDNDYSMLPTAPRPVQVDAEAGDYAQGLTQFMKGCMEGVDKAAGLCQTLCCAFDNPGVEIRNAGRVGNMHIHITCTQISCIGVIIECPIPNAHSEHPQKVLQGMINNKAEMSTTHPVVVQMTS